MTRDAGSKENQAEMAARGRQPAYDSRGNIRGYRSAPGAPQSNRDTIANAGIREPISSGNHGVAWDRWFANSRAETARRYAPAGPTSSPGVNAALADSSFRQVSGGQVSRVPMSDDAYLADSAAGNKAWMAGNGFVPPPRPMDRSMPAAPFTPKSPSTPFVVPTPRPTYDASGKFIASNGAANLADNFALAAPGGASGLWRGQRPPASASQWTGPAAPVSTGDYSSQYGTASVRNVPSHLMPSYVASSNE